MPDVHNGKIILKNGIATLDDGSYIISRLIRNEIKILFFDIGLMFSNFFRAIDLDLSSYIEHSFSDG